MKNLYETDPEFAERLEQFAFHDVVNEEGQQLDDVTRHMAVLAEILGWRGAEVVEVGAARAGGAGRRVGRW